MRSVLALVALAVLAPQTLVEAGLCRPGTTRTRLLSTTTRASTDSVLYSTSDPSSTHALTSSLTSSSTSSSISSSTPSSTSSTSHPTATPRTVTNLLLNGNFPFYHPTSPGGIFAFEVTNQARQVADLGYTGDGNGETGCVKISTGASDGALDRRQVSGAGDRRSSIQQLLVIPGQSTTLTVRVYYAVLSNDVEDTCQLRVTFNGILIAASPPFNVAASSELPQWTRLAEQIDLDVRNGLLKFELICINGGTAEVLLDQAVAVDGVSPEELENSRIIWPALDDADPGTSITSNTAQSPSDSSTVASDTISVSTTEPTTISTRGSATGLTHSDETSTSTVTSTQSLSMTGSELSSKPSSTSTSTGTASADIVTESKPSTSDPEPSSKSTDRLATVSSSESTVSHTTGPQNSSAGSSSVLPPTPSSSSSTSSSTIPASPGEVGTSTTKSSTGSTATISAESITTSTESAWATASTLDTTSITDSSSQITLTALSNMVSDSQRSSTTASTAQRSGEGMAGSSVSDSSTTRTSIVSSSENSSSTSSSSASGTSTSSGLELNKESSQTTSQAASSSVPGVGTSTRTRSTTNTLPESITSSMATKKTAYTSSTAGTSTMSTTGSFTESTTTTWAQITTVAANSTSITSSTSRMTLDSNTNSTFTSLTQSTLTSTTSWTISVSATLIPSTSMTSSDSHPLPTSLDDLSPGAREIYDFILDHIIVDENGNVDVDTVQQGDKDLSPSPFNPDDTARQEELENQLQDLGLGPVDDLVAAADAKADAAASGTCPNLNTRGLTLPKARPFRPRSRRQVRYLDATRRFDTFLSKRDDDDEKTDAWDIVCHEAVSAILGMSDLVGGLHTLMCQGKALYDSRDAIKCIFGGCGPMVVYEQLTYPLVPEWKVWFPSVSQWLLTAGTGNKLSCVDCSFYVSSLKFTGQIVVWSGGGKVFIKEAKLVPEVTGTANMLVELITDRAWTSSFNYVFEALQLESISPVNKAFSITPKLLYNIGVKFSADKAVNVRGGARFSLNQAKAQLNMDSNNPSLKSKSGWEPSVSYILPSFSTSGGVVLQPYIRWGVELSVNLWEQVRIIPAISSESIVTIKSSFSFDPQNTCAANKLSVSTFLTTRNKIRLKDGVFETLWEGDSQSTDQCYDVPGLIPSPEDIKSLASDGAEFCTSFINYQPPKATRYATSTVYTPSSTVTKSETTTIPITTTKTATSTSTVEPQTITAQEFPVAVTVTDATLTAPFPLENLKRHEAVATPGNLAVRVVATPAVASGWDSIKMTFACRQVATGTSTITQTLTQTAASGVTTSTVTVTENLDGPLVTTTETETWAAYHGFVPPETPTSNAWEREPTATACAEPEPESGTCFRIKIHGPDWVDGQYLKYYGNAGFVAGNAMEGMPFDTYYLTSSGRLVTQDRRATDLVIIARNPFAPAGSTSFWTNPHALWAYESSLDLSGHEFLHCSKDSDPCSRALYCRTETMDGISFVRPRNYLTTGGWLYTEEWYVHYRPHVGTVDGGEPATLTWEPAPCICGGEFEWVPRSDWQYVPDEEEGGDGGHWEKIPSK